MQAIPVRFAIALLLSNYRLARLFRMSITSWYGCISVSDTASFGKEAVIFQETINFLSERVSFIGYASNIELNQYISDLTVIIKAEIPWKIYKGKSIIIIYCERTFD